MVVVGEPREDGKQLACGGGRHCLGCRGILHAGFSGWSIALRCPQRHPQVIGKTLQQCITTRNKYPTAKSSHSMKALSSSRQHASPIPLCGGMLRDNRSSVAGHHRINISRNVLLFWSTPALKKLNCHPFNELNWPWATPPGSTMFALLR